MLDTIVFGLFLIATVGMSALCLYSATRARNPTDAQLEELLESFRAHDPGDR